MPENNEQFDSILLELLEQEESKLYREFGPVNRQITDTYKAYRQRNAVFDEAVSDGVSAKHAEIRTERRISGKDDYAACLGLNIALNLCVAKDLKDAIDARFANEPDNALCTQMKQYVDQKLEFRGNTREEIAFAGTIKHQFDRHISANGTTRDFLSESYEAFDMSKRLNHGSRFYDEIMGMEPRRISDNFSLTEALCEANRVYAKELHNTVIAPFDYRFDSIWSGKNSYDPVSFIESYKKQEVFKARNPEEVIAEKRKIIKSNLSSINDRIREDIEDFAKISNLSPQEIEKNKQERLKNWTWSKKEIDELTDDQVEDLFSNACDETKLKDFHKLSQEDKLFSSFMFRQLVAPLDEHFSESERHNIDALVGFDSFLIDGKRAESEEEVVMGALSGKKIESDYFDGKTVTILPDVYLSEKTITDDLDENKSFLSRLFSQLWESIKSILGYSDEAKERKLHENAVKMDENLAQSQTRQKMTFAEVADDRFSKKLISPEKRQEIKNKQLEKNNPTKK